MTIGWSKIQERAQDVYWLRRRNGGSENEALAAVLDDCYRDETIEELRRDVRAADEAAVAAPSRAEKEIADAQHFG